jgi:predicted flap endonuclease-1-like 5' DNA nuclease
MATAEFKNGFNLWGFALGAAAGVVALGVGLVVGRFDLVPAVFIAALVAGAVGLILGLPWGASDAQVSSPAPSVRQTESHAAVAPAAVPVAALSSVPETPVEVAPAEIVTEGRAPERLSGPRGGNADDLKQIEGIGPVLEKLCHELGFYHFDQIANWSAEEVAWVDANMPRFRGRIVRDKWVEQAKIIVTDGLDAFRIRAQTNDY